MERKKTEQMLCTVTLTIVLALFFGSFAIINFLGFPKFCTTDMYQDVAYSMLAWQSKSIFPQGWVFGNQYYVFATPVLCALFYGLTGNVNFSMALATTVMTGLILLAMWHLIRPFTDKVGRLAGVLAMAGCMITANAVASLEGQLFYVLASYYAGYLITVLVVIGDYLHAVCLNNRRGFSLSLLLSAALCFAAGMQSLRLMAVLVLPIMATEFIRILFLNRGQAQENPGGTWAGAGRALLYALSNFLGAALIGVLSVPSVTIYGSLSRRALSEWKEAYEINLRILSKITGFYYAFTEENGLLYFAAACFFAGVVIAAAGISLRRYVADRNTDNSGGEALFDVLIVLIFAFSLAGLFALNLLFDMNYRTPYLFVWYPLTALSCVMLLRALRPGFWKTAAVFMLCIACVGNWYVGYAPAVKDALDPHDPSTLKKISEFVVERGYTYVYGDLGIACPIATYANGRVLAASSYGNTLEILPYINPQGVYGEYENRKAVYIFYGYQDVEALEYARTIGARMTLVGEFLEGYFTLYTSDKPLMHYGSREAAYIPDTP